MKSRTDVSVQPAAEPIAAFARGFERFTSRRARSWISGRSLSVETRPLKSHVYSSRRQGAVPGTGASFDRANTHLYRTATMDREALIFLHIPKQRGRL